MPDQSLVESAYLAAALLQAPKELWEPLDAEQRTKILNALKLSRKLEPHQGKWLLFSAMVEAVLWQLEGHAERRRIETALNMFEKWYLGDGTYGDGPQFHWDYTNSHVIHPVMLSILRVLAGKFDPLARLLPVAMERAQRNGEILERLISPEATFPVMGRSSAYRFAAFQLLAVLALHGNLPQSLDPGCRARRHHRCRSADDRCSRHLRQAGLADAGGGRRAARAARGFGDDRITLRLPNRPRASGVAPERLSLDRTASALDAAADLDRPRRPARSGAREPEEEIALRSQSAGAANASVRPRRGKVPSRVGSQNAPLRPPELPSCGRKRRPPPT